MSITLELPPELERELAREAERLNLSVPEYAARLLAERGVLPPAPRTGAELVTYWESAGVIGSQPEIADASAHARKLREEAERRVRG